MNNFIKNKISQQTLGNVEHGLFSGNSGRGGMRVITNGHVAATDAVCCRFKRFRH